MNTTLIIVSIIAVLAAPLSLALQWLFLEYGSVGHFFGIALCILLFFLFASK